MGLRDIFSRERNFSAEMALRFRPSPQNFGSKSSCYGSLTISKLKQTLNSVIHGKEAGIANHYCPSLQNSVMQQEVGEILISLLCNKCVTPHVTSVIRFWVELAVDDGKDSAMFVVFDREMTKLTKQEAVVLALEEIPNGGDEELPSCLGELARKEFFSNSCHTFQFHRTFTV
ncbi:PREDICTED: uncharacterized protein LOC106299146 [Brassica oleracea var. oleracea]|uniref:uncharacterized protein LOC106299146 n=1 Tax=Brassica oleracea var. oleracea TaxID=109376 RepID=UPI0006A74DFB|nr:PREDICTED: uncharacterized protein LOC106299146 [Brassica oleracea var. oleracea]